ncbi:hypothetical protein HK405_004053 [Cladochytrium tenue]|nr:hypothetical protein HK405_004053 [Cladochytrium tenue]
MSSQMAATVSPAAPTASATSAVVAGATAGMDSANLGMYSAAVALASLLVLGTGWRLVSKIRGAPAAGGGMSVGLDLRRMFAGLTSCDSGGLGFVVIAFLASLCYEVKVVIALVYGSVLWLNPQARYSVIYSMFNLSTIMLYFLYERRLSLLFQNNRIASVVYSWTLRVLLLGYLAVTFCMCYFFSSYAANNATGGYVSAPPTGYLIRVANYTFDVAIDVIILAGTFHAMLGLVTDQRCSSDRSRPVPLYKIVLGSDCTKFIGVAAIEAYKLANTTDPTGALGASPIGNTGFQHLIDTLKTILLVTNLFASVVVGRAVTKVSGGKNSSPLPTGLASSCGNVATDDVAVGPI